MEATFKTQLTNRNICLNFLNKYSLEQLNHIPTGFSNNLIWNIGHIVVVQQRLIYALSNLPLNIPEELLNTYKPGTKPTGNTTQAEVDELKTLLISLVERTKIDYSEGKFQSFNEITTSTGFNLASTDDAITFNNFHEGLHLGYMLSIRKFI
jgi:hypothetical protein